MTSERQPPARHSAPPPSSFLVASLQARWRAFHRWSVMDRIGAAVGIAAVVFAVVLGVVEPFFLAHRETAICDVDAVSGPLIASRGGQTYWDVTTSCGSYDISTAPFALDVRQGAALAASLNTTPGHNRYELEFQGWGAGRDIVAARPAD